MEAYMAGKVVNLFFSPTRSSEKIGELLSEKIALTLKKPSENVSYTLPKDREKAVKLSPDDVLVFAFPVYNGRVPAPILNPLKKLQGSGCAAVPVAVYGNRAFDDSLLEAADILTAQGCKIVAAIGAVAQHTFDEKIGQGRPDASDKETLRRFAEKIAKKIANRDFTLPKTPGNRPYLTPADMPPLSPATSDACNYCGICAKDCPMGIIDPADEHKVAAGCIVCTACVKYCPQKAKSFPKEFLDFVQDFLEKVASARREAELFI